MKLYIKVKNRFISERALHMSGLALALVMTCVPATARIVYAQTGSETSSGNGGSASDSDSFSQLFDDVSLATPAAIRSVKWWGNYGPFEKTPVAPFSFQLIFYGDSGGLPDPTNVLGFTTVAFATLSPPVEIFSIFTDTNYYEFRANITPTFIPADTKVWFSVFANTANDSDDSFLWRVDDLGNSARRDNSSGVISESINSRPLFVLYDTPLRPVTAIYADDFSAVGGLDGSPPDVRPGTETWSAATAWQADGTTASVNSNAADDSAFLPFTPLPGKIYTLSATLKQPIGGYSANNTNAWAAIGFSAGSNIGAFAAGSNNPSPWMHVRRTGATRTVIGPANTGTVDEATYDKNRIIKVVLDTNSPNWSAEWFMGLRSLRKHTFATNPVIAHIGIAREDGVAADFDSFSLTAEDGDAAPKIVSFSSVGNAMWELELAGNPGMPFELCSSTELDFSPGTLIENLTQENPATDPGTIGGSNNETLTTDANGSARVRFTLTGQHRDFVRAVALP